LGLFTAPAASAAASSFSTGPLVVPQERANRPPRRGLLDGPVIALPA